MTMKECGQLDGLTLKERRFVDAYLGEANGNGTRAAKFAGYSGSYYALAVRAHELLKKRKIREAVDEALEHDPLVMGRVERLRKLTSIARGEAECKRFGPDGELVDVPVPLCEQRAATVELAKLAGDYDRSQSKTADLTKDLTVDEMFSLAGIPRGKTLESGGN